MIIRISEKLIYFMGVYIGKFPSPLLSCQNLLYLKKDYSYMIIVSNDCWRLRGMYRIRTKFDTIIIGTAYLKLGISHGRLFFRVGRISRANCFGLADFTH